MADEQYEVVGKLRLSVGRAGAQLQGISGRLGAMAASIRGTQGAMGGLTRSLLGLGAGYVGFQAIVGGFRAATHSVIGFTAQLDQTRIGLGTVLGAVEGVGFQQGLERSSKIFEDLKDDALTSVATAADLFGIFQGIVGPIRNAGFELDVVREITKNTVTASTALGVDLQQAQRDISLMVRGAAGMDVKLFSLLRSMGLITEETEDWNKSLTAAERVEKLRGALSQMEEAGAAFGESLAGRTSSFKDIIQQMSTAFGGPVTQALARGLGRINEKLLASREQIGNVLRRMGFDAARFIDVMFDRAIGAMEWLGTHWDELTGKLSDLVRQIRDMAPMLLQAAKAFAAIQVGRSVIGGGLQAASTATGVAGWIGSAIGGGGEAASAGVAGGEVGMGVLGAALAPLAAILAAVSGLVVVLTTHWEEFLAFLAPLMPILESIWTDFQAIGVALWDVLVPVLKLIGVNILPFFLAGILALVGILKAVTAAVRVVVEILAVLARDIEPIIDAVITAIFDAFTFLAQKLRSYFGRFFDTVVGDVTTTEHVPDANEQRLLDLMSGKEEYELPSLAEQMAQYGIQTQAPEERPQAHYDFRGSRISIKQELTTDDPDRILMEMKSDLARQAEQRLASNYVNPLTR